ncbi:hypothetical protein AGLY_002811 [Aphis glycines]|uniref:DDE Tnp4 domain-containing protein n=1 Tax=Aphis glycines TaxID=307491 RepID=A0A6G0U289_APHGL|nr:hypothetical protein AGLY_002811 [Aphis glycines]
MQFFEKIQTVSSCTNIKINFFSNDNKDMIGHAYNRYLNWALSIIGNKDMDKTYRSYRRYLRGQIEAKQKLYVISFHKGDFFIKQHSLFPKFLIVKKTTCADWSGMGLPRKIYLSTGTNFVALQFEFLLGRSTISSIVREMCQILWETLQPQEMPESNPNQWTEIANKFYLKTNFPNCIGAVDGKYIRCINPNNSGSIYFNYKKYFSIVLMAVVDAEYIFTAIDVDAYGREADSTVFKECPFGKKLYSEQLNLPAPTCLPNTNTCPQPYVIIGDGAFGLHKNLLRPYAERGLTEKQKIFDYRLSRARRYVECTFGTETGINLKTLSNDMEVFQNRNSNRNLGASQQGIDVRDYIHNFRF